MKRFRIELEHLPEDGKQYEGVIDGAIFGIDDAGVKCVGDLSFDVYVQRFEGELFIRGRISAPFEFTCARCLKKFVRTVAVDDCSLSLEIDGQSFFDVSDDLREEVLLAFLSYPKCEDSDEKIACDIQNPQIRVDKEGGDGVNTSAPSGDNSVWDALDSLRQ